MKKLKQETENERVERRIKELEEAELKEKYKKDQEQQTFMDQRIREL
jgi:hypothetical protein